jgi:hypothetical protein
MRTSLACLLLVATSVSAAPPVGNFDPVEFEKRFHKADANRDGQLSRQEAYAEFPRMPEFFDEIDANRNDAITLPEVTQALERRVNAAFKATQPYAGPAAGNAGPAAGNAGLAATPATAPLDALETERAIRNEYYESLGADKDRARDMGEVVPQAPSSPLFEKRF